MFQIPKGRLRISGKEFVFWRQEQINLVGITTLVIRTILFLLSSYRDTHGTKSFMYIYLFITCINLMNLLLFHM